MKYSLRSPAVSQNPYQSPRHEQPKKRMTWLNWLEVALIAVVVAMFAALLAWVRVESRKSAERDNPTNHEVSLP